MSGEGGGIGGVDPGGDSVARGRSLANKVIEQRQQFDAARVAMQRRFRLAPIGAAAAGPTIEATTTEKHVLQSDFTTASSTTMVQPVEVVRDTDGKMTFFASQSPKCTEWFDDLDSATVGTPWTASNTGAGAFVGAASDHVTAAENAYGEFVFTPGTTTTGRACIYMSASSGLFGTAAFTLRWRGTVGSAADATDDFVIQSGFIDNPTANAEPTNAAFIAYRRATDGNFWVCVTRDNGVETKTVTSVAPADYATLHTFEIAMNQAGTSCVFKIDGATVATHTTNIPTAAGRRVGLAFKHYKTAGTNARYSYLDYAHLSVTRTTDR